MKRFLILIAAPLTIALAGCMTDGYGGVGLAYGSPYVYDGWYDGHYGPIYDGYWGGDGYFYYRSTARDRRFHRGDRTHFSRQSPPPGRNYQPIHGTTQPSRGTHMPHYPGHRGGH